MPLLFREGLVFMPGEEALFEPDKEHKGKPCVVNDLVPDENNVLSAYMITLLDSKENIECALDQLVPIAEK